MAAVNGAQGPGAHKACAARVAAAGHTSGVGNVSKKRPRHFLRLRILPLSPSGNRAAKPAKNENHTVFIRLLRAVVSAGFKIKGCVPIQSQGF